MLCRNLQVKDILPDFEFYKINKGLSIAIRHICPNHYGTQRNECLIQTKSLRKALSTIEHLIILSV